MAKIKVIETDDVPICPYCEKELTTILASSKRSLADQQKVCFCPHCRKVLGVAFTRSAI